MKVAIDGNTIDTKYIYRIGDIKKIIGNYKKSLGVRGYFKDRQLGDDQATIGFTVYLYDNREIDCFHTIKLIGFISQHTREEIVELATKDIRDFENRIIKIKSDLVKIWSDNQSEIPQFNSNKERDF